MDKMTITEIEKALIQGTLDHITTLERLLELVDAELRWIEGTGHHDLPEHLNFTIDTDTPAIRNLLADVREFNNDQTNTENAEYERARREDEYIDPDETDDYTIAPAQ
jgi:hypothetical protein